MNYSMYTRVWIFFITKKTCIYRLIHQCELMYEKFPNANIILKSPNFFDRCISKQLAKGHFNIDHKKQDAESNNDIFQVSYQFQPS